MTDRQYQLLFLRYFPGMPLDYVVNGPDGNGMPWDWWVAGCDLIDEWLKRGV